MRLSKPDLTHADPRDAARWVRSLLRDVHLPQVRLPRDVQLPRVRLPDVHFSGMGDRGREAAAWVVEHAPFASRSRRRGPEPSTLILPVVLAAAGAGAAIWWWTQWSRGRAEQQAVEEGAADPSHIMDHAPAPTDVGGDAPNPSAGRLAVPAEAVMAHQPLDGERKPTLKSVEPVVAPVARQALKRSLAVQASAEPPKPKRAPSKPSAPKPPA